MKKLILLSITILAWICFVNAQPPENNNAQNFHRPMNDSGFHRFQPNGQNFRQNRPGMQGGPQFDRNKFAKGNFQQRFQQRKMGMLAGLHLTPDQMKQGKTINQDFRKQVADLQKNDKISLGEYKNRLAALHKDRKAKIQALLTDQQKNQIAQRRKNTEINAQVQSVARLERMKLTLGLSDDQVAKIKSNQSDLRNKLKAIRENDALLPEQKKEAIKLLMEQRKDIVKSVLTPEQQSKVDSLKKNFRENNRGGWNRNNNGPDRAAK
jgi:Spy/CpxP family protein refolding chaperone